MTILRNSILAICTCLVLAACGDNDTTHDENVSDERMMDTAPSIETNVPAARDSGEGATNTNRPATAMSDANIFAKLDAANTKEVEEGKIGVKMATNAEVKKFAQMLITEHSKMKNEGAALATKLNVTPQLPPNDPDQTATVQSMQRLSSLEKGMPFEMEFMRMQVEGHQKTLNDLTMMEAAAQSEELRNLIRQARPAVEKHLEHAKQLHAKHAQH